MQEQIQGAQGFKDVAISVWAFGAVSCKPLHFKGTWPGLPLVRTGSCWLGLVPFDV